MPRMGSENPWPPKPGRLRLLPPVFQMVTALVVAWAGVRTVALGSAAMGLVLLVVGAFTAALAARQLINRLRSPSSGFESSGELSKDQFDYIVWASVGVPVVLVLALLIFVLTENQ